MEDLVSPFKEKPVSRSVTAEDVLIEMRERVCETARLVGGASVKQRIARAATQLGVTFGRAKDYVYNEVKIVRGEEVDNIRHGHELARLQRLRRLRAEYETSRRIFLATASPAMARLASLELPDLDGEPEDAPAPVARRSAGAAR